MTAANTYGQSSCINHLESIPWCTRRRPRNKTGRNLIRYNKCLSLTAARRKVSAYHNKSGVNTRNLISLTGSDPAKSLFNDNIFLAMDIHSLMLGFLFTVLIGFGTRVTIGHSGNMMIATPYVKFLFVFSQIVVIVRLAVSIVASLGYNFMIIFDISITMWLLMFIFWLYKFFAVIVFGKKLDS